MKEIIVLAEHRRGELRDVTWEMLSKGRQLAESIGAETGVALLGNGVNALAEALRPKAHRVFLIEDQRLEAYTGNARRMIEPDLRQHGDAIRPVAPQCAENPLPSLHLNSCYEESENSACACWSAGLCPVVAP